MAKWDEYFAGRKWRVREEVTGIADAGHGITIEYDHGRFEIAPPGVFHSPLSTTRGRKGALLQELDGRGADIPGSCIAVGFTVLKQARDRGALQPA